MIVGGILVGASGTILTVLMCNAMNRSLVNVLIGGFGGSSSGSTLLLSFLAVALSAASVLLNA